MRFGGDVFNVSVLHVLRSVNETPRLDMFPAAVSTYC